VRWVRASADIAKRGEVIGEGENAKPHPLLVHIASWERTMLAGLREFGLTPQGEANLAKGRAEATRAVRDLDALDALRRESAALVAAQEERAVLPPADDSEADSEPERPLDASEEIAP